MNRTTTAFAAALLVIALAVAPADAKKKTGFKTGTYKATGTGVNFKFKVYKGTCYVKGTKKKTGYCLSGFGPSPTLALDCPDVEGGVKDHTGTGFVPNQKYIPSDGKIKISFRNPVRAGEYDDHKFTLSLGRKGSGSGTIRLDSTVKSSTTTSTCTSGTLKYKAKK